MKWSAAKVCQFKHVWGVVVRSLCNFLLAGVLVGASVPGAFYAHGGTIDDPKAPNQNACVAALQGGTSESRTPIIRWLFQSYAPFDYEAAPITVGEEIEGFVPISIGDYSRAARHNYFRSADERARAATAEVVLETVESLLRINQGEEVVESEYGSEASHIKYQTEPLGRNFLLHPHFDLFRMSHLSTEQTPIKTITVTRDASLYDFHGWVGVEIISPIRSKPRDYEIFDAVVARLQERAGLQVFPERQTGFHVHVGAPGIKAAELVLMLTAFAKIENELRDHFGVHFSRRSYALPTPVADIYPYVQARGKFQRDLDIDDLFELIDGRDYALNIHSLRKHGTIEFRLFDSTLDPERRKLYRQFATRFVQSIRAQEPALVELLLRYENSPTIPLREYLAAIE